MIHTQPENKSIASLEAGCQLSVSQEPFHVKAALFYFQNSARMNPVNTQQSVTGSHKIFRFNTYGTKSLLYPSAEEIIEASYVLHLIIFSPDIIFPDKWFY